MGAGGLTPGSLSFLFPPGGDRRHTHDYALVLSAIEILERRENERPFCIFVPMSRPHPPYTVPADFYNLYAPSQLPPLIPPGLLNRPSFHDSIRETYGLKKLSEKTFRKIRAVYYGQVSYSDWLLGELLDAVERTNHTKDTAIIGVAAPSLSCRAAPHQGNELFWEQTHFHYAVPHDRRFALRLLCVPVARAANLKIQAPFFREFRDVDRQVEILSGVVFRSRPAYNRATAIVDHPEDPAPIRTHPGARHSDEAFDHRYRPSLLRRCCWWYDA
jgi:Sulfatase